MQRGRRASFGGEQGSRTKTTGFQHFSCASRGQIRQSTCHGRVFRPSLIAPRRPPHLKRLRPLIPKRALHPRERLREGRLRLCAARRVPDECCPDRELPRCRLQHLRRRVHAAGEEAVGDEIRKKTMKESKRRFMEYSRFPCCCCALFHAPLQ